MGNVDYTVSQGAIWVSVTLALEFLVDAATIRSRSYAWMKGYVKQRMSRLVILHGAIIVGAWAMMLSDSPFVLLYALIALKTVVGLAAANVSTDASASADEPPLLASGNVEMAATSVASRKNNGHHRAAGSSVSAALEDEQVMPR